MATAAAANESRSDLLNWINDLLQLNISKIEQVGTGAVLCQIFDSIYGNVALHKVKFNTHNEYEYIQNFKVLQTVFTQNGIDKV
jgi:RP/EB family microtubule-associated protein